MRAGLCSLQCSSTRVGFLARWFAYCFLHGLDLWTKFAPLKLSKVQFGKGGVIAPPPVRFWWGRLVVAHPPLHFEYLRRPLDATLTGGRVLQSGSFWITIGALKSINGWICGYMYKYISTYLWKHYKEIPIYNWLYMFEYIILTRSKPLSTSPTYHIPL